MWLKAVFTNDEIMKVLVHKIYGNISNWSINSAEWIGNVIDSAIAEGYEQINVHMHCYGGSVVEGNAIITVVENCTIPINLYIDGLAASMAAITLPSFDKVFIAKNAFVMTHAPRDGNGGTAAEMEKTIKVLKSFEDNFVAALIKKTGKTDTEIRAWLVGDNWFNAKEALKLGLVDEIVEPVAKDIRSITKAELKTATAEAVYERFSASINPPNNDSEMDKKAIIARYGLTSVTEESTEEQIYAAIDAKLASEKTAREAAEAKVQSTVDAQITAAVTAAIGSKKITDAQKDVFVNIGKTSGIEALNAALDAIKPVPSLSAHLQQNGGASAQTGDRSSWNWEKWQTEDPRGLEALAKNNPDQFKALYDAEYK